MGFPRFIERFRVHQKPAFFLSDRPELSYWSVQRHFCGHATEMEIIIQSFYLFFSLSHMLLTPRE